MSKCVHCDMELSGSVLSIHQEWCESKDNDSLDDASDELKALREKAKELGIKNTGSKKLETLQNEIDEIEKAKE